MVFSVLEYQYRDAGGYKISGELLIEGVVSENTLKSLRAYLYDAKFFIPKEIGIPPLQPKLWEQFGGPNDDDHEWHTFEGVRNAEAGDMNHPVWGTEKELVYRFQQNRKRLKNTPVDMFFPH